MIWPFEHMCPGVGCNQLLLSVLQDSGERGFSDIWGPLLGRFHNVTATKWDTKVTGSISGRRLPVCFWLILHVSSATSVGVCVWELSTRTEPNSPFSICQFPFWHTKLINIFPKISFYSFPFKGVFCCFFSFFVLFLKTFWADLKQSIKRLVEFDQLRDSRFGLLR